MDEETIKTYLQYLKKKLAPLILRREKTEILDELPEKTESVVYLDFDKDQEKIYKDVATSWNETIKNIVSQKGALKAQLEVLTAILRLRQVCSIPSSLPNVQYNRTPPKIETIINQIKQLNQKGHKALIFTNFLATLNEIQKHLEKENITNFSIHGSKSKKARESSLKKFEEYNDGAVMLMTLKTGGVGLNLTCANYVFHIEPWWNPAAENQATDRAHRMGQKNKVMVYRYIMKNSIEEKIIELKDRKQFAIDGLFSEDINIKSFNKSNISVEDFQSLVQ
jgi:SNF2 family DNA or RNA helicase